MSATAPEKLYVELLVEVSKKSHTTARARRRAMERAITKLTKKYGGLL